MWSGCVMKLKEQSLLFLPSQICWEWPQEWRTRQLFSCLWPRGREGDYRRGVGDTHGNGDFWFFFLSFPPRAYGCFGLLEVETRLHASKGFGISTHKPDSHQL